MSAAQINQHRFLLPANGHHMTASCMKPATGRRITGTRYVPRQYDPLRRQTEVGDQVTVAGELEIQEVGARLVGFLDDGTSAGRVDGTLTALFGRAESHQRREG